MDDSNATEFRAVRFALHPGTRRKGRLIAQTAGATRFVWNHCLARNQREYAAYKVRQPMYEHGLLIEPPVKPPVSFFSLGKQFTEMRRETPWLQQLPFDPVRYALKYQADAWKRAFAGDGFPKFKARMGDDSFTLPDKVRLTPNGWLRIPKIGWVKLTRAGGNPYAGQHRPYDCRGGSAPPSHDALGQGNGRRPGYERARQGRAEPLDSGDRMGATARHARIQGGRTDCRTARLHVADLPGVRVRGRGQPQGAGELSLCSLRTRGERGRECRAQYSGPGD